MNRRVSGAMSRPFMNMYPVERMATRFGGMGIRSGAYGRAAAQYAAPVKAHMTARRLRGGMESAFSQFFRDQERERMKQQRQMTMLQGAGGIAGDLAEYLAGRKPGARQPMAVDQLSDQAMSGLTERQKQDYRTWAARQPRGDFRARMSATSSRAQMRANRADEESGVLDNPAVYAMLRARAARRRGARGSADRLLDRAIQDFLVGQPRTYGIDELAGLEQSLRR